MDHFAHFIWLKDLYADSYVRKRKPFSDGYSDRLVCNQMSTRFHSLMAAHCLH
ncbi:hypothetical protein FB99_37850 [Pantoea agglomerans]|nr:hypothetical protein FB99_37850 [Pantoea agglomerans]